MWHQEYGKGFLGVCRISWDLNGMLRSPVASVAASHSASANYILVTQRAWVSSEASLGMVWLQLAFLPTCTDAKFLEPRAQVQARGFKCDCHVSMLDQDPVWFNRRYTVQLGTLLERCLLWNIPARYHNVQSVLRASDLG